MCHWQMRRVYLWLCGAAVVSCVLGVLSMGSPSWSEGRYGDYEYLETGLLVFCHQRSPGGRRCAPILLGSQHGWMEAVRILAVLSWVFLFTVIVLSILLHIYDDHRVYSFLLTVFGLVAGVLGLAAAIIYTVPWASPDKLFPKFSARFSWGYALFILTHVTALCLFIAIGLISRHMWTNQFRVRRSLKTKPARGQGNRVVNSSMEYY